MTILSSDHARIIRGLSPNLLVAEAIQGVSAKILNLKFRGRCSIR